MFKHSVRINNAFISAAIGTLVTGVAVFGTSVQTAIAKEVEPLDARLLITACKDYSTTTGSEEPGANVQATIHGTMCRSYLQGYFAATDDIVAIERIPSPLTIRAMKNRGARISEDQKVWKASYCMSEIETLKDIAGKIANVDSASANEKTAQVFLREFLSEHYSCENLQ